jgi:NADH-quinone oxidoreductase subunit M
MGAITTLIMIPLLGMLLLLCVPEKFASAIKWLTVAFTATTLIASLNILAAFNPNTFQLQFAEAYKWIPAWGITLKFGIDGISIWLILLTTLLTLLANIYSFYVDKRPRIYFAMMLLLEAAMIGVFTSLDLILFYTFFEATLIPMAIMIFIWGGSNRNYAAIKFFLYTFAASIFMLLAMITMANRYKELTGTLSFDLTAIQALVATGEFWQNTGTLQTLLFWAVTIALLVKCPMFPFHTWLPDAHTEAPTAGSVILAGVLLKMGTFGLLRLSLPLFPEAAQAAVLPIMILSVIGIIYGAIVAAVQPDVKKLVAYSSVAHMGFVVFGIFSLNQAGMMGGAFQQLAHGISTGALFLLIGLIYERTHTRAFKDYGGLKAQMPIFSALFLIVMLSSVGLPGMNGFVGEFLALYGGFMTAAAGQYGLNIAFPILAGTGVILAAAYLLHMFRQVFYGPLNPNLARLKDLKPWEIGLVGVFVVFIFWGGIYPNTFLKPMERSINAVRMMTINPPGERPVWNNPNQDIDDRGNLVIVSSRTEDGQANISNTESVIAAPNFYQFEQGSTVR